MSTRNEHWYQQLDKPSWAPGPGVFAPVWSFLYTVMAISYGVVISKLIQGETGFIVVLPFLLNVIFNLLFAPLQFKLMSNRLALIDVILVDITLVWAIIAIYPYSHWIAYAQIPYLLWTLFATALQTSITVRNK